MKILRALKIYKYNIKTSTRLRWVLVWHLLSQIILPVYNKHITTHLFPSVAAESEILNFRLDKMVQLNSKYSRDYSFLSNLTLFRNINSEVNSSLKQLHYTGF